MHRALRPRIALLALALLALASLATFTACGGGDDDDDDSGSGASGAEVTIRLVAFQPEEIEIAAGETVTWVHDDTPTHTVTSGDVTDGGGGVTANPDGTFESGDLSNGDTFEHTFDEPGTYPFFCAVHPATMRGVVTAS